jgi:hypothetical protein
MFCKIYTYDFHIIIFKINHKLHIAPEAAPQMNIPGFAPEPAYSYV